MKPKASLLLALVGAIALLVLPGGASSAVDKVSLSNGILKLTGTDGEDLVTVSIVPGIADPTRDFFEINDPGGIAEVPSGCFRKDANTIHCPVELVKKFAAELLGGDDDFDLDFGDSVDADLVANGGGGDDEIIGDGNDKLIGGAGNDKLAGGKDADKLIGGKGRDRLIGGTGKDTLKGGPGKDRLKGGAGRDTLNGGPGNDTCNGGPGPETLKSC